MINLIWRTDAHLADHPPQSRVDDWATTILSKLKQVGQIAGEERATVVLDGGDLFHVKSPSRTSHELIQRVTAVHHQYPCPVLGNVGNHDVKYGEVHYLNEAPLGVLFKSGIILPCYNEFEYYIGGCSSTENSTKLYPFNRLSGGWLNGNPFVFRHEQVPIIRVVGIPYHGNRYDMNRFTTITKGDEDYLVVMAHCLASPRGGSMFDAEDIISYKDIANLDPDIWAFGHWHKDQKVQKLGSDKWVINVGSLSRGSTSQDLDRTPSIVVMRFSMQGFEIVTKELDVQPAAKVFDLVGQTRKEAQKMTVDALVDNLKTTLQSRQDKSLLEDIKGIKDVPEEVKERTLSYLEKAGAR